MSRRLAVGALIGALYVPVEATAQQLQPPAPAAPSPAQPVAPTPAGSVAFPALAALAAVVQAHPAPFAALSASATSLRDSLVARARAQIGRRYRIGGESPDGGFDCSGLVRYVMSGLKVPLPRTANQQARAGREVPRDESLLRPGDLVTFGSKRRISHIGIYVGEGRFVHASTKAGRVIESKLDRPPSPLIKPWRGVRRVIVTGDSAAVGPAKG
ncbi:MAG: C40 family peptidase [Gemmatimonadaceae bacterium]